MKYVKNKKKYLLLLIILLVGIVTFSQELYWNSIKLYNVVIPDPYKIDTSKMVSSTLTGEMERLEIMLTDNEYNLYQLVWIGEGMMTGSTSIKSHDGLKILEQFYTYNTEKNIFLNEPDYVLNVILTQWFSGNVDEMKELIELVDLEAFNEKQRNQLFIIKVAVDLTEYNLESLEENLKGITLEEYEPIVIGISDFVDRFYKGNHDTEVIHMNFTDIQGKKYLSYFEDLFTILRLSSNHYNETLVTTPLDNKISGHVTLNGEPVPGAFIYPTYHKGMSTSEGFDDWLCVTDENGYYEITDTYSTLKGLTLIVPWQRFRDKQIKAYRDIDWTGSQYLTHNYNFYDGVKFKVLKVSDGYLEYEIEDKLASENRVYYIVVTPAKVNDQYYGGIDKKITFDELRGKIAIDTLRNYTDLPFNYSSSKDDLAIERFMEPLYLSGNYYFKVNPNDTEGNSYIWNGLSSDALLSLVWIDGEEDYNKGDQLLASRAFDKAKEWYADNPSRHNLRVLVALYMRGTTVVDGEYYQTLTDSQPSKAIPFVEQSISLYGSTYGRRADLANLYRMQGDFKSEEKVLLDNLNYDESAYEYFRLACNYFNQGRYLEGVKLLVEKGDIEVEGDRYYSYFIIGDQYLYLPEHLKMLLETLDGKEVFMPYFSLIKEGKTIEAYEWLLDAEDSELRDFYILNMLDSYSRSYGLASGYTVLSFDDYKESEALEDDVDFYDYYRTIYDNTKREDLKEVYKLMKEDSGWIR